MIEIHTALPDDDDLLVRLSSLLVDCVRGGASVEFLSTVTVEDAAIYWAGALARVAVGQQVMLVAREDDELLGTVSLVLSSQQNQQHRGEISKLLVAPTARRRGIANQLMESIEREAWSRGRTLLVLDTVTGSDASRVYDRRDWNRVGEIPDYALNPAGELVSTTYYWKSGSSNASPIT